MSSIVYIALKGIPSHSHSHHLLNMVLVVDPRVHFVESEFFAHLGIRSKDHSVKPLLVKVQP